MKILVLAENYTSSQEVSLQYVHTRNLRYIECGNEVDVLSFKSSIDYEYEGVKVFKEESILKNLSNNNYDVLVCHAPNLKNHYRFLKKNRDKFNNVVFFFHGHEVMKISRDYSKPYDYVQPDSKIRVLVRDIYDEFKFKVWKKYFTKIDKESVLVFVSEWMKDMFVSSCKIDEDSLNFRSKIIYNSVGSVFENNNYDWNSHKEIDFLSIRSSLDGSKYCVDIIADLAEKYPNFNFTVVGKGKYFDIKGKPQNVKLINDNLSHEEILKILNKSKYALLPTRVDAQGVMACEFATFGIPLITSDIPVCHEVFNDFDNVFFIDNENSNLDFLKDYNHNLHIEKNKKYFVENTVDQELKLFEQMVSGNGVTYD